MFEAPNLSVKIWPVHGQKAGLFFLRKKKVHAADDRGRIFLIGEAA